MDLTLSASDKDFVATARQFLARHWRSEDIRLVGQRGRLVRARYFSALADSGRLVGHWPKAHGGLGWTPRQRWLWELEAAGAQAPQPPFQGTDLLGPALMAHGTDVQKQRHLAAIADGSTRWCQAFGEDSGGLDLAQLETRATPLGATAAATGEGAPRGWLLAGTKPWVLDVPAADDLQPGRDWVCLLARIESADPTVSFGVFLVDLASPGVRVTPRRMVGDQPAGSIDGYVGVGSISFDAVQVSVDALLQPVNQQATLARKLEEAEYSRPGVVARNAVLLTQLREFVEGGELDGGSLWRDEDYRRKLHELEVAMTGLQALQARALDGAPEFARAASLLIASRSRLLSQQLADLQVEALGYFALPYADVAALDNEGPIGPEFSQPVLFGMLSNRAREAVLAPRDHLKNIIAKSVLGLSSATLLRQDNL